VACPTCNLLVMTTLGMSGALSIFAPLQPFIGAAGIVVLAATLRRILRLAAAQGGQAGRSPGDFDVADIEILSGT
jgi:hypothetical protein